MNGLNSAPRYVPDLQIVAVENGALRIGHPDARRRGRSQRQEVVMAECDAGRARRHARVVMDGNAEYGDAAELEPNARDECSPKSWDDCCRPRQSSMMRCRDRDPLRGDMEFWWAQDLRACRILRIDAIISTQPGMEEVS